MREWQGNIIARNHISKDKKWCKLAPFFYEKNRKKDQKVVSENTFFSIFIKISILVATALGFAGMWIAFFGDVGALILATLNAMRVNSNYKLKPC